MRTASATLALTLALACGRPDSGQPAGAADTSKSATATIGASAGVDASLVGPRNLLDSIYLRYETNLVGDLSGYLTTELTDAFVKLNSDEVGLGYDPFCRCQDTENFRYTIQALQPAGTGAQARVSITNAGASRVIPVRLALENNVWKVADVGEGAESVLRLAANPRP